MKINLQHPLEKIFKEYYYKIKLFTNLRFKLISTAIILLFIFLVSSVVTFFVFVYPAPDNFPKEEIISISDGKTLSEVASHFEKEKVVGSAFWLESIIRILGNENMIMAGKYFYDEEENIFKVASSIISGNIKSQFIKITIPEGATVMDIAQICENRIENFDKNEFLSLALKEEGFLFPDTYHFPIGVGEEKILNTMNENFENRIENLEEKITNSEYSLKEIITMASLLEKEAITYKSKRIIAGILWRRIEIGMRLQVDAVFLYINGKNTFDLTYADLAHDSPYNTYKYEGLPSGPIANPGLESIEATLNPIETEYLFYLSDMQNKMHYSETFEEHKRKKRRYLN